MAAVAQILLQLGSGPSTSDVLGANVRYKLADDNTQNTAAFMSIPATGENLSWRKAFKVNWTSTPTTLIGNLRFFTTGVPSGLNFYARHVSSYTQGSSADVSGIAGFTDSPANKATFNQAAETSTSPLVINAGAVLSNPSTGVGTQDFTETQMGVLSTYVGGAGASIATTCFFRYDES